MTTCTHATFAKPTLLAKPATARRTIVCKASEGSNRTLQKLAGAAAAVQFALTPFAGSAVAVDLPNPLDLAQDARGKADSALSTDNSSAGKPVDLPGPAPSLDETKKAIADVARGNSGLKEAARSKGANISATGDISDLGGIIDKAASALPSTGNAAGKDPVADRQALVDKMNSDSGTDEAKRGGGSGHPRAATTGDVAFGDILGKAKEVTPDADDVLGKTKEAIPDPPAFSKAKDAASSPIAGVEGILDKAGKGEANLPPPASKNPDLRAAVASKGANISRTEPVLPEKLRPGNYAPS